MKGAALDQSGHRRRRTRAYDDRAGSRSALGYRGGRRPVDLWAIEPGGEAGHDSTVATQLGGVARRPAWGRPGVGDPDCGGEQRRRLGVEVPGHKAVVEGQPGRSLTHRDRVERQSSGGDAGFELGGPIATAAERVEERVEGCGVEDRVRGLATEGLVKAEAG